MLNDTEVANASAESMDGETRKSVDVSACCLTVSCFVVPPIAVKVRTASRSTLAVLAVAEMLTLPLLSPSVLLRLSQLATPVIVQWVLLVTVTS